ncbi:MAG: ribonuclease R [Pirellulales bacterium]|nr:ribonuclease R [Pirellulales bacterium]
MNAAELESQLLALVANPKYRPAKPRVLAEQLGLTDDQRGELKRLIKQLVKRGQLRYGANHHVEAAGAPAAGQIVGVFRRAQAGFGFVRPKDTPAAHGRRDDIFIPAEAATDAASGDVVMVELRGRKFSSRGNPEGRIVEVIERDTHQFVGTYFESAGSGYVQVDGTLFQRPVAVGDPGAKNARPDDKVVFEMVRFPSHWHDGEGVITEVLGPRGQPGIDTLSIIREFELPEEFAEDALAEARAQAAEFDESIGDDRLDLTALTVVTIDPVDARDFDDAISLERTTEGHWRLGVHIADVSHFVRPKSALDREALARATSVYLPDRVLPMLPELISNGLASLQPDKVRYTKTAFLEFTSDGTRVSSEFHAAAIRSCRRFTYEEIDNFLAHPQAWRAKLTPQVHELVQNMHTLAMVLRERRRQRGAIELTMREVKIDLDKEGRVAGAHLVENTVSHQMIEECMLAANEAVAEHLRDQGLLFLRRLHLAPDPRKLEDLTKFVVELGYPVDSLESRFELQRLLKLVAGRPEEQAINYAVLRSLQQAVYGPDDEGHYALASDCYCHFTSPIRRYPDLTVHRLLELLAKHKKPTAHLAELLSLGDHCSQRERRAEAAERELTKVKLLNYLAERIGQQMDAVITGVEEFGLFAQGVDLPAEGLIHVSSLSDDYYRYDRTHHTLTGHRQGNTFRLGDPVCVAVARVDADRRELDFRLVARRKRPPGSQPPAVAPRGKKSTAARDGRKPGAAGKARDRGGQTSRGGKKKRRR